MGLSTPTTRSLDVDRKSLFGLVESFIKSAGLQSRIVERCEKADSLKTLIILVDAQPIAVVLPADEKLDLDKLSSHTGIPRARIRFAASDDVQSVCGFPVGSVPPFAHRPPLRILVDSAGQAGRICGGCGDPCLELETSWEEIRSIPGAETADLVNRRSSVRSPEDGKDARISGDTFGHDQEDSPAFVQSFEDDAKRRNAKASEFVQGKERKHASTVVYSVPTQYFANVMEGIRAISLADGWSVDIECRRCLIFDKWQFSKNGASVRVDVYDDKLGNVWPLETPEVAASLQEFKERGQRCAKGSQKGFRSMVIHDDAGFQALVHALLYSWWSVLKRPDHDAPYESCGRSPIADTDGVFGPCTWTPPMQKKGVGATHSAQVVQKPRKSKQIKDEGAKRNLDSSSLTLAECLKLCVPAVVIDSPIALARLVEEMSTVSVVGLDCEWRSRDANHHVALLQVATHERVVLVDCVALSESDALEASDVEACDKVDLISELLVVLFSHSKKVIGFGPGDLVRLKKAFTRAAPALDGSRGFVDLQTYFGDGRSMGLSRVCAAILGVPLDKTQQKSDWELRPLSDAQITYAALDAYCLLSIYDCMQCDTAGCMPSTCACQMKCSDTD